MANIATILQRVCRTVPRLGFWVSVLLLLVFVCWVWAVTNAGDTIESLLRLGNAGQGEEILASVGSLTPTAYAVLFAFGLAVLATCVTFIGLFIGRRESRSLRSWLCFSALLCGWLATLLGWKDIHWHGQCMYVAAEVEAADKIASAVLRNWPEGDGDHPELGIVLGYPKGNPTTLILAGEPVAVGKLRIVSVEKSDDGKMLRFQLAAPNNDTWLVYNTSIELANEFVNGFGTRYIAVRTRRLSERWYLVLYDSAAHAARSVRTMESFSGGPFPAGDSISTSPRVEMPAKSDTVRQYCVALGSSWGNVCDVVTSHGAERIHCRFGGELAQMAENGRKCHTFG